jgi:hypothetical protein
LTTTSTVTLSSVLGTFAAGEAITGGSSSRTATVATSYDSTNQPTALHYHTPSTYTLTVSSVSGTFQSGETITGGTSGRTATISGTYDSSNFPTAIHYESPSSSSDFTASEAITGSTSEATATATSTDVLNTIFTSEETLTGTSSGATATAGADVVTRTYVLASDVLTPYSFVDETNGGALPFKGWDWFDAADPEQDETGNVDAITIEGIDATTGLITIALYPLHSTTNETIRYRYLSYIPDWAASNDTDNLDIYLPQVVQPALYFAAAEMYTQEKGDSDSSGENRAEYEGVISVALNTNLRIWGNRKWRRRGDEVDGEGDFGFFVQEGSLTA